MSSLPPLLLICGMPASGKTTFGDWLRDTHDFLHLDLERGDCLTANHLPSFWSRRIWELDAAPLTAFVRHLRGLDRGAVLTWGFHIDCLPLIETVAQAGAVPWWFEVDRLAARRRFAERRIIIRDGAPEPGTPDPAAFDRQFGAMAGHWAQVSSVFGDRVIRTLGADDHYLSSESILSRLMARTGEDRSMAGIPVRSWRRAPGASRTTR